MKKAESSGKSVRCKLSYSNLSFDLWILLHKVNAYNCVSNCGCYLKLLQQNFKCNFASMKEFKEEKHFKQCLNQLTLLDVKEAIRRAKYIHQKHILDCHTLQQIGKYAYYKENPALNVHEIIEKILIECGLIGKNEI